MPSDSALVAHWLDIEPGAQRLVAEHGRGSLLALARIRVFEALSEGERAWARGASWESARQVALRAIRALD